MIPNPMMGGMNPMQMLQQLKSNPVQFLMQRKMRLPQNINASDPQAILNHLVQSGQVTQDQINQAYSVMQKIGRQ